MEAIGVVASIGGIVQLTLHGIQFIAFLRTFAGDCGTEATAHFLQTLVAYAQLLHDVQMLCEHIQKHKHSNISQIRTATLRLYLEDCVHDLETWHNMAKRIERTDLRVGSARLRSTEAKNPKQRFQQFLRQALGLTVRATDTHVRTTVQARFDKHKNSVGVALSILEANLQLAHVEAVDQIKVGIDKLTDLAEAQEKRLELNNSDFRSSNDSVIAWSKSHNERLQELQSMQSSLSAKMDSLLQALSSHGSQHSSVSSNGVSNPKGVLPRTDEKPRGGTSSPLVPDERTDHLAPARSDLVLVDDKPEPWSESDESGEGTDSKPLVELLEDFHLLAGQYFDGIVAEYIFVAERWRFASIRQKFLGIISKKEYANRVLMNVHLKVDLPGLATTLLSLRRRAEAECLHSSLEEADGLLGITIRQVGQWEQIGAQKGEDARFDKLALPEDARNCHAESLTRLNEWLFAVMTSIPYLAAWHRSITSTLVAKSNAPVAEVRSTHSLLTTETALLKRDEWERLTIKFWLFDGTNMDVPDGYAASSFTNSHESELTVLAINSDDEQQMGEFSLDETPDNFLLLKQPVADIRLLRGLKSLVDANELTLPSPSAGREMIDRAEKAITAYAEESSMTAPKQ